MNHELITTAFELPNHRIVRTLGVVRGITVRSRSVLGTIGATLQTRVRPGIHLVRVRKGDATTELTNVNGGRPVMLRVTFVHVAPPSRVT